MRAVALVLVAVGAVLLPPGAAHVSADIDHERGSARARANGRVDALLERAVEAMRAVPHAGELVVISFGEQGPRIARLDVTFGDGAARITREGGTEVGIVDGRGFLRTSSTLLQVIGVERVPTQLDRLHAKYTSVIGRAVHLDTGPATPVTFRERATSVLREALYADENTGLIVRRETYGRDGAPVRTVAYTRLATIGGPPTMPSAAGRQVQEHRSARAGVATLADAGFDVPSELPLGYELITAFEVANAPVPTLHLIYGDGIYTLSVFGQRGRMAPTAVVGATELRLADGGAVWRWPGSEPRRIVWRGDGTTYTALGDAPTDELLVVVAGLPTDPPPSILDRLSRGLARVMRWFPFEDRSET